MCEDKLSMLLFLEEIKLDETSTVADVTPAEETILIIQVKVQMPEGLPAPFLNSCKRRRFFPREPNEGNVLGPETFLLGLTDFEQSDYSRSIELGPELDFTSEFQALDLVRHT